MNYKLVQTFVNSNVSENAAHITDDAIADELEMTEGGRTEEELSWHDVAYRT